MTSTLDSSAFAAVIVAGGLGNRFQSTRPKQFTMMSGRPVLRWSVDVFALFPGLAELVIVCHSEWLLEAESAIESSPIRHLIKIIPGGEYRQDSCRLGLEALTGEDHLPVLIHDAARPWVSEHLITTVLKTVLTGCDAVIPVIGASDSVVLIQNRIVLEYPERATICNVQTPQGFRLGVIRAAHQEAFRDKNSQFPDDGSVALDAGYRVVTIPGHTANRKITYVDDIETT